MKSLQCLFVHVFVLIQSVCYTCNIGWKCPSIIRCENQSLSAISINCNEKGDIKRLYFDHNSIKNVNSSELDGLQNIEVLSLKGNKLEYVHKVMFYNMSKLWSINLSQNNITFINSSSFGELSLTKLQVADNQITAIYDGSFCKLSNLLALYLSRNKIKIIEEGAFSNNIPVRELYLDNNLLQKVTFLKNLHYLMYVNLSFNQFQVIPNETFVNATNLTTLNFNNNLLESFDFVMFLRYLQKLNLSYNAITELKINVLNRLINLRELFLAHNQITHIGSGTFSGIEQLKFIDLSFNKIISIGEILENSPITVIYLNHNNLTNISIPNTASDDLQLYIDGNRWNCQFIKNVLDRNKAIFKYTNMTNTTNIRGIACRDGFERHNSNMHLKIVPTTTPKTNATAKDMPGSIYVVVITIAATVVAVLLISFAIIKMVNFRKGAAALRQANWENDMNEDDASMKNMTYPNKALEDCDGYLVPSQIEHIYAEILEMNDQRLNTYV